MGSNLKSEIWEKHGISTKSTIWAVHWDATNFTAARTVISDILWWKYSDLILDEVKDVLR